MILTRRRPGGVDWDLDIGKDGEGADGQFYDDDLEILRSQYRRLGRALHSKMDLGESLGMLPVGSDPDETMDEDSWGGLRDMLVTHFVYCRLHGYDCWVPHAM
jgi:hypothetical protein